MIGPKLEGRHTLGKLAAIDCNVPVILGRMLQALWVGFLSWWQQIVGQSSIFTCGPAACICTFSLSQGIQFPAHLLSHSALSLLPTEQSRVRLSPTREMSSPNPLSSQCPEDRAERSSSRNATSLGAQGGARLSFTSQYIIRDVYGGKPTC